MDRNIHNGIHWLLGHTDYVNLLDRNIHNTKKNTKDLFTATKAGDLEANVKKIKQSPRHVNRIQDNGETER